VSPAPRTAGSSAVENGFANTPIVTDKRASMATAATAPRGASGRRVTTIATTTANIALNSSSEPSEPDQSAAMRYQVDESPRL